MYAEQHRYQPRQPRVASAAGALLLSGVVIAGMIYASPNVVKEIVRTFPIAEYRDPPPPPVDQPRPKPEDHQKVTTQPPIFAPKPVIEAPSDPVMKTTPDLPPVLPSITKPVVEGPPIVADPPRVEPAPALIGAKRDPRYAEDFQPPYPASKLRTQEDGRVSVRVLVGTDGRVKAVEQLSATSSEFFDATRRQALSRWRFKPATRGGVPQESWMTLSVTFRIQDQ